MKFSLYQNHPNYRAMANVIAGPSKPNQNGLIFFFGFVSRKGPGMLGLKYLSEI